MKNNFELWRRVEPEHEAEPQPLPCPFCGHARPKQERFLDCGEWHIHIRCFECLACGPAAPFYKTKPENSWATAAKRWNKRQ